MLKLEQTTVTSGNSVALGGQIAAFLKHLDLLSWNNLTNQFWAIVLSFCAFYSWPA